MEMKSPLVLFWLMLATLGTIAQKATLSGTITTSPNRETAVGAVVMTTSMVGTSTDVNGKYSLSLDAGQYVVVVSMMGFENDSIPVLLLEGEIKIVNHTLRELASELNIVVVSAGKFEQRIGDITVSMEVISPRLIQNRNTTSMETILQQTPGVSIVDDEPQIRSGSGYSFGAGSRVQVLLDDIPILSGDAGKPSWGFLPVENVEQVEVIKGASSVLYGSSALSGVINVRSAYPKAEPQTRITLFQGAYSDPQSDSAKYWKGTPLISGLNFFHSQQAGQWDVVFGGNFLSDMGALGPIVDSTGKIISGETFNPFEAGRYNSQARGRLNANIRYRFPNVTGLSAGVNTNWSKSESYATLLWDNSTTGLYRAFDDAATFTKQTQGNVSPFIQYFSPRGFRHSLKLRWTSLDNNNDNSQGNFSDTYYGEYQFQLHFDSLNVKDMTLTAGVVALHTAARGELFTGHLADGNNTANNVAEYAQLDKKFFGKLNISCGVRFEYFNLNDVEESRPVFRSGASYELARATYLRTSFGQGYRFPSMAEKFIITEVGALRIFPNSEIKSETSYNAEVGLKQGFKFGKVFGFADVAVFQQVYENFIEFTFGQWETPINFEAFPRSLGFKSLNTGTARVRGIDVSVMGQGNIKKIELNFIAGYTYTKPVSLTPDYVYATSPVPEAHPQSAETFDTLSYLFTSSDVTNHILKYRLQHLVRIDVEAKWKRWMLGGGFRSNSHMQNIDQIFLDLEKNPAFGFNPQLQNWRERNTNGDFVIDARIAFSISKHHRISVIMNNVLNREYAIRPLAIEDPRLTTFQYVLTL